MAERKNLKKKHAEKMSPLQKEKKGTNIFWGGEVSEESKGEQGKPEFVRVCVDRFSLRIHPEH